MKKVQQAGDYTIFQKRSGRYAVQDKEKNWVNAEEKTKILLDAALIKAAPPKPPGPETEAEAEPGEETAAEAGGANPAS
jgi:hypothetical protein